MPGNRGDVAGRPGGWLPEWISLGVLASSVPREVVDAAVAASGRGAKRSGGKLPPHVIVYYAMALALFADEDYEAVMAELSETLASWGCWDQAWVMPTSGGITQARVRLGSEPLARIFDEVAVPVADQLTRGAWLGPWRLMAIDGVEWDLPDTPENVAEFGYVGSGATRSAFPKARVVAISECASHAVVAAAIGGMHIGEPTLARRLWDRLEPGWLLTADREFYGFTHWNAARATGAELLWRVSARVSLPVLHTWPDGSYASVLVNRRKADTEQRAALVAAAGRGEDLDPDRAVRVRVVEYTVPDRPGNGRGETFTLITTILDPARAPAGQLARAYHQRWEHETGNAQLKTHLRGPGRILRSHKPDTVRQEIYGYLLTHYAISALICRAATAADIDPDRVKFQRTVRIVRRRVTDSAAFPP
ncbi:MAG TPA: IS4 family transposase [Propionibacteriaceae bacterium]|nr:IS4 family transposase [Propionibacteriaceae bacterium]